MVVKMIVFRVSRHKRLALISVRGLHAMRLRTDFQTAPELGLTVQDARRLDLHLSGRRHGKIAANNPLCLHPLVFRRAAPHVFTRGTNHIGRSHVDGLESAYDLAE